jgi:hypothetical protein
MAGPNKELGESIKQLGISFLDLLEGIARGQKIAAARPGAMRIDPAHRRAAQKAGDSSGVLDYYNANELLGPGVTAKMDRMGRGVRLQFEKGGAPIMAKGNPADVRIMPVMKGETMGSTAADALIDRSGKKASVGYDTSYAPPGSGHEMYQMLWDMNRPTGRANTIDVLTGINQFRRPGNLMSYGLAHGDYGNIQPFPSSSFDPLPFADAGLGGRFRVESRALESILPNAHMHDTALKTTVDDMLRYSPDALTGALALRELQLARSVGSADPAYLGAEPGAHTLRSLAHPMDPDALKMAVEKARDEAYANYSRSSVSKGFGTGLMGRAGTTEELIRGMHQGRTPEEIMEELLRYRGADEALKGRYAKGGAIHAAIAD